MVLLWEKGLERPIRRDDKAPARSNARGRDYQGEKEWQAFVKLFLCLALPPASGVLPNREDFKIHELRVLPATDRKSGQTRGVGAVGDIMGHHGVIDSGGDLVSHEAEVHILAKPAAPLL